MRCHLWFKLFVAACVCSGLIARMADADDSSLIAHWKLNGDVRDYSGNQLNGVGHAVEFSIGADDPHPGESAAFNGVSSYIEVPHHAQLNFGTDEFSISAWVHTAEELDDVLGDIASKYDPKSRKGFVFNIKHNVGGTTGQANYRHVQFGIDDNRLDATWTDNGRPGEAILIFSLAVFDGDLYAGTCAAGKDSAGHVYRYDGEKNWIDCGAPDRCNAVSAMAAFDGKLYAAVSKYRLAGSSLTESENPYDGGKIYCYEGDQRWVHVGTLPEVQAINGMVVYRGKLYVSSMYAPAGLFRYDGHSKWTNCGSPGGKRVEALCVYNGDLFATGYDEGAVYRYDGQEWHHCGLLADNTQTYSFAIHHGRLYVGTWRSGRVYRYEADHDWTDVGRLGEELEVMGMAAYNGNLYAGTLPLAEVYRFDGIDQWYNTGRVDFTPDVRYRRAWTMAVFGGRLFVGTLPSGHVMSIEAGKSVTQDHELPPGWVHLAAVKSEDRLRLYVGGALAAESTMFDSRDFDLTNTQPLKIGFGPHDYFNGRIKDVRLYRKALSAQDVADISGEQTQVDK